MQCLRLAGMDTVLNRKFGSVKRKIAFIIDNCTYHSEVENLEWTELIFPSPKHQVTYSTDRPRCNSCCKTQTSFTSRLQTNFSFGLKRTNANHIHSVCYDDVGKGVECFLEQDFYQLLQIDSHLRERSRKSA